MIVSVKPQHIAGGAKKTPQERIRIRKEKTLPALDEYFKWIRSFDPDHIIKGKFRDGIVYSQNQEEALRAFLLDGRLPCSNNAAERSFKRVILFGDEKGDLSGVLSPLSSLSSEIIVLR